MNNQWSGGDSDDDSDMYLGTSDEDDNHDPLSNLVALGEDIQKARDELDNEF